ncbi:pyridoxal phosphate-dependent aminotransferase [Fastidiosibacter lacustris]|uniref:pyridoxal phosphate-dependent aminotransferase n=1 Tax=Fastidiosibacter lacustris TaxID=2056695 RepID=UPI00130064DE|nr:pyridoxal phosphate-dependent aminotransferase [Fastidiosibacter lacustris]
MFDKDIVSLAHGDGIRRPHPDVLTKGIVSLLDSVNGSLDDYLYLQEHDELKHNIFSDFIEDGIDQDIAKNIAIDFGSSTLICSILQILKQKLGSLHFVIPTSYYHNVPKWFSLYGGNLNHLYTKLDSDYKLTAEELILYLNENKQINGLFLQNPTHSGAIYTKCELKKLAQVAYDYQIWVIVDSVFSGTEFDFSNRTPQLEAFKEYADKVITVKSASKRFNLANLRIGWCCGSREIISEINSFIISRSATIPKILGDMVSAAFCIPKSYFEENSVECKKRVGIINMLVKEINHSLKEELVSVLHQPESGHGIVLCFDQLLAKKKVKALSIRNSLDFSSYALRNFKLALSPAITMGFDKIKIRVAYSSVGLKKTYLAQQKTELQLSKRILNGTDLIEHHTYSGKLDLSGFHEGRKLLTRAFENELTACLKSLI